MKNFLITVGILLGVSALTAFTVLGIYAGVSAALAVAVYFLIKHVWDAYPYGYLITWGLTVIVMVLLGVIRKAV
ncbi:hypothetical protein LCGC14_3124290 [marine sediment metagenome]|uniref:Uncharacterized protein n=1 Tax=marine sediment metagenome TaxID=412755 RepID=A0A0F8WQA9_9ZZZZ